MAERLELLRRRSDGCCDLGVNLGVGSDRVVEKTDLERRNILCRQHPIRRPRWGGNDAVSGAGAHGGVENRSAVADGMADDMLHTVSPLVHVWTHRHATSAWFESDQATHRSGNPDRATPVACVCRRNNTRSDCRSRAARRAAGAVVEVPWVAAWAVGKRLGRGPCAELGSIGTAKRDEPGGSVGLDQVSVPVGERAVLLQRLNALVMGSACLTGPQVLHQDRHTRERPRRQASVDSGPRIGIVTMDDGVDVAVDRVEALDRRLEDLRR